MRIEARAGSIVGSAGRKRQVAALKECSGRTVDKASMVVSSARVASGCCHSENAGNADIAAEVDEESHVVP